MFKDNKISVVIPAYNVEKLIGRVILTMPNFIDKMVVVDDNSTDKTNEVVQGLQGNNKKIILIKHDKNQGVGGAIATGYKWSRDNDFDVAIVMAGDAQMDPDDLPRLLEPVVGGEVEYSKGNRLSTGEAFKKIPRIKYFGNSILSFLTKIASGYWHVTDSQSGYTAINKKALKTIDWAEMYKRYGQPNDLLVRLNVYNFKVRDVAINPIYNIGEKSGIKLRREIFTISWLLLKLFIWRLREKYIIRDFHPLVFFYFLSGLLSCATVFFVVRLACLWIKNGYVPPTTALVLVFCAVMAMQSGFFAMWFDMESNKNLK